MKKCTIILLFTDVFLQWLSIYYKCQNCCLILIETKIKLPFKQTQVFISIIC